MPASERNNYFDPGCRLKDDGALANPRHERLAILLAEGFDRNEALKAEGAQETITQGRRRHGRRIFTDPTFMARVKALTDEREEIEKDPVWGQPLWMTMQLWRSAVLAGDIKTMMDAVKLRTTIAEKRAPAPTEEAPSPTAKGPGRPPADSTQTKGLAPAAIRAKMMQIGQKDAELDEDSEVEGEA